MPLSKRWICLLVAIFVVGASIPFLLRLYDKHQRLKVARQFAHAIQTGDFQGANQFVLMAEKQHLNVIPETMKKAFEILQLPPIQFLAVKVEPMIADIRSFWQLPDGRKVSVFLEMMKENNKWRVNFFFTFRRFCSLKLRLQGWDIIKAFQDSRPWAVQILKAAGVKGYVSDFGTIRSFEGELIGIVTP